MIMPWDGSSIRRATPRLFTSRYGCNPPTRPRELASTGSSTKATSNIGDTEYEHGRRKQDPRRLD